MQKVFNADILMENPDNFVRAEHITNIIPNNPYYVTHSIYFAESLTVFEDAARKNRLVLNVDYEYASLDSVASELSNKDCYRAIIFLKHISQAYIDYHSYGDLVSAELLNRISENTERVKEQTKILSEKVADLTNELFAHQKDTAPHSAQESVFPNVIPLRSTSGTLKAADATDEQELTTLGQINKTIKETKNDLQTEIQKAKEEALDTIDKNIKALIDNAPENLNTLKKLATLAIQNKLNIAAHQIILESRMPLNPVCAYDMADVHTQKQNIYTLPAPIMVKDKPTIIGGINIYTANSEGAYYHIHTDMSFTGNAKPAVIVYRDDWKTMPLWEYCNGTQDFSVFIEKQNFNFLIGVWMQGAAGYQVQPDDSVSVSKFMVTKLTDRVLIDSSGNGNHATVSGGVTMMNDNAVGAVLSFDKGFMKREPLHHTLTQWSHSRWVKITGDMNGRYLYYYGHKDFATVYSNTVYFSSITQEGNELGKHIDITLFKDKWVHLVVENGITNGTFTKKVYLNGKLIETIEGQTSALSTSNSVGDVDMGSATENGIQGSFASLLFFDRFLTESEILWLSRNQYYPVKRYSLAEYKADENRKILEQLKKEAFCFRGDIAESDLDKTVTPGSYKVNKPDFSTTLLVFESRGSIGVVQFYKEDYNESTPWKYRHALDGDTSRWTAWQTFVPTSAFSLSASTLSIKM